MSVDMDVHRKSVDMDMDMDVKFHIHGNPGNATQLLLCYLALLPVYENSHAISKQSFCLALGQSLVLL